MVAVLKTAVCKSTVGSNPTTIAKRIIGIKFIFIYNSQNMLL